MLCFILIPSTINILGKNKIPVGVFGNQMESYFPVNNNYSLPWKWKKFPTERLALMTQNKFNFMKNFNYLTIRGMKLNADTESHLKSVI